MRVSDSAAGLTCSRGHCLDVCLLGSQIKFMAEALLRNSSVVDVRMQHNNIEQDGAEALLAAVKRLECFSISGKNMAVSLFAELHKPDGGGKKGKKGKKKK